MATYQEMAAQILRWSKRPDVDLLPIDDFMDLAYRRVAREIKPAELDTEQPYSGESATRVVIGNAHAHPLPALFLRAWGATNNGIPMKSARSDKVQEWGRVHVGANAPAFYCIVGSELWVAPGAGGDLRLIYNEKDKELDPAAPNGTNFGLTNYPEAYLAAGLIALFEYVEDEENEQRWLEKFLTIEIALNLEADRRRRGGGAGGTT